MIEAPPWSLVQQMGEEDSLRNEHNSTCYLIHSLPSVWTGIEYAEALVQDTDGLVLVGRVVIGIVTLTHRKTRLEI